MQHQSTNRRYTVDRICEAQYMDIFLFTIFPRLADHFKFDEPCVDLFLNEKLTGFWIQKIDLPRFLSLFSPFSGCSKREEGRA